MSGSRIIKVFSDTLFKAAKLNKFVAHHIRIGCQPLLNLINGIGRPGMGQLSAALRLCSA